MAKKNINMLYLIAGILITVGCFCPVFSTSFFFWSFDSTVVGQIKIDTNTVKDFITSSLNSAGWVLILAGGIWALVANILSMKINKVIPIVVSIIGFVIVLVSWLSNDFHNFFGNFMDLKYGAAMILVGWILGLISAKK